MSTQKIINDTPTRLLVNDILEDKYQGEDKKYAIDVVKARFVEIAEKLTAFSKMQETIDLLERENETLKESIEKVDNIENNAAYAEALEQNSILSDNLLKSESEIKRLSDHINNLVISNDNTVKNLKEKIEVLENKQSQSSSSSHSNSFKEIFETLDDNVGVKLYLVKEGDIAIVTAIPEPKVNDSNFVAALPPITVNANVNEIDGQIVSILSNAMTHVSNVTTEIVSYEKSVAAAKALSDMEKSKKTEKSSIKKSDKSTKKEEPSMFDDTKEEDIVPGDTSEAEDNEETLLSELETLEADGNIEEAINIAERLRKLNPKHVVVKNRLQALLNNSKSNLF